MYCPSWIYEICVARSAMEFLFSELGLNAFVAKYAKGLNSNYSEVNKEHLLENAEGLLQFLSEIDAGEDAAEILKYFTYYKLNFESANVKRKLKPLFGSIEDPVKTDEIANTNIVRNFKAFVFAIRSNTIEEMPKGWQIELDENIPKLADIISQEVDILDIF